MFWRKKSKPTKSVHFLPEGRKVSFDGQHTVLELALREKLDIGNSCEGMGSCGTCRVIIEKKLSALNPRNKIEEEMANDKSFLDNERLSCQTIAIDGLEVTIPQS